MIQPNPAYELRAGGWYSNADGSGPYSINPAGVVTLIGAGGGGGGGGAATIADGADVATGAKADAAVVNPASSGSVIAVLKGVLSTLLGLLTVNTLAAAGAAKQLPAAASSGSSANMVLTTTTRRISMRATGSAIRYAIGTGAQTASASSHLIGQDERLDLAVPANAQIAVLSATTTVGVLEVTELL